MSRAGSGYLAIAFAVDWEATGVGATWVSADGEDWIALSASPVVQIVADGPAGVIGLGVPLGDGPMPAYALR